MTDDNILFFCKNHRLSNEEIVASIDCFNQANPFSGSLILTNQRLVFIREVSPASEFVALRLSSIDTVDYEFRSGIDFFVIIKRAESDHDFLVKAMDNAKKTEFLELVQLQVARRKLCDADYEVHFDAISEQIETSGEVALG